MVPRPNQPFVSIISANPYEMQACRWKQTDGRYPELDFYITVIMEIVAAQLQEWRRLPNVYREMSVTAHTSQPSPRPTKPKCSVVVALTLTQSTEMPKTRERLSRISAMCGASLGA